MARQGQAVVSAHDRLQKSQKAQKFLEISNLELKLKATRKKSHALATKLWKQRTVWNGKKIIKPNKFSRHDEAVQSLVAASQMDSVRAMEESEELQQQAVELSAEKNNLCIQLKLTEENLTAALKTIRKEDQTDFPTWSLRRCT
jgi:hypothetical protein